MAQITITVSASFFSQFWKEDQRNVKRSQLEHGDLDLTSFMQREILS